MRIPRAQCLACGGDCYDGQGYCDDCRVVCKRCSSGMLDPDEVDARGICTTCRDRELARQNVKRLEAWAVAETRRRLAAGFALETTYWPEHRRRRFAHAVLVWETSGERKELRKIVAWLMHDCRMDGRRFVVHDPATSQVEQFATRESAR